jgi:hypothetical protein
MAELGCLSSRSELDEPRKALDRVPWLVNGLAIERDPRVTHDGALDDADAHDQARIGSGSGEKTVRKQAPFETVRAQVRSQARNPGTQRDDSFLLFIRPVNPA